MPAAIKIDPALDTDLPIVDSVTDDAIALGNCKKTETDRLESSHAFYPRNKQRI